METAVLERPVRQNTWSTTPVIAPEKKKSFEEAVAECDGRPASEFFDELRRQVKEHFKNA
jgi:hypothetical protein